MALFYMHGTPIGYFAILLALVASMGGFIFGYDTGQISDILLMTDFKLRFATCTVPGQIDTCEFTVVRAGLIVSLLSIGTLVGALCGAPTADYLGRRYAMVVECALFIIGVIIQTTATTVWQQFAVGRWVSGLAVGALSAAVPMYQAETAPARIRGTLTATYQLFITFGILVAYCISIGTRNMSGAGSWRTVVAIGIIWPCILAFGIIFMPESPRWLAARGRYKEACHSLARSHGIPREEEHTNEFLLAKVEDIRSNVEYERHLRAGWIDCFRPANKTLYRTILGMSLQSFQQLTGANYFFYYGATIFTSVGIEDSFVTQIILGAVNFVCTFGGFSDAGIRSSGAAYGRVAGSLSLPPLARQKSLSKIQILESLAVMIVSACMFILGYAMTWAPGVWILIGETFPTRTRAKQGALSTASNWHVPTCCTQTLWNFLLAFFTPFIVSAIEFRYGFVFAACNLAGAIFVWFFLYESNDLSLESVDHMYNDPACKPWTSSRWAPPGYASRYDLVEQTKAAEANKPLATGLDDSRMEKAASGSLDPSARDTMDGMENETERKNPLVT
ncbi:hypothetical protein D9615_008196 [Tricholomella constricta]|uniref:Major facilitator superfamily (MFS) profile domain-containing protein n=1 Tax=Tricholomella constricta TaxID=117010 RepID=A0A8H5H2Q0_9AGAR|nr:hypothetical protein D9615_008196 [Tricholomella constricta]